MTIENIHQFVTEYPNLSKEEVLEGWNRLFKRHDLCKSYNSDGVVWGGISDALYEQGDMITDFLEEEIEQIEFVGGESEGEYAHEVLRFKAKDLYVKAEGSYYSYDGFYWYNDYELVTPRQVTVTRYY